MKKLTLIFVFLAVLGNSFAQTHTRVFTERVRTLRADRYVLTLGENEQMQISFDEMSHDLHFYTFSVSMTSSQINSGEFLRGFTTKDITDYDHSINTSREYTHYWFEFPNEDMQPTKSGDYCLTIYEDGDPDKKVAQVDFSIVEPLVLIDAKVRANTDIELNGRFQQLDIDVNTTALNLRDPNEVRIVVTQNNRTDNAVTITKPTFIESNRLRYINNKALIFEGGNEYHHFDAFSTFYAGTGIDRVRYELGDYHVQLFPDEITKGQYIHQFDSDGRFVVNAERTNDSDTEAEYMWVHWTLPAETPWFDGALYVGGDIFNNELSLRNRMQYDAQNKFYWLTALVKQGGYDYQYWFVPKSQMSNVQSQMSNVKSQISNKNTTTQRVDGSYWQTENEYMIYVYWKPFGSRYEQLVGVKRVVP